MQPLTEPSAIRRKLCEAKIYEIKSQIAIIEIGGGQMMAGVPNNLEMEAQIKLQHTRMKLLEDISEMDDQQAFDAIKNAFAAWLEKPSLDGRLAFEIALYANRTNPENWMMQLEQQKG